MGMHEVNQAGTDLFAISEKTTLLAAAQRGDWNEVRLIIETENDMSHVQPGLCLTFSLAVYHKMWRIVELFVKKRLDPNGKSLDGQSAIIVAASSDAWTMVTLFSEKGADLEVRDPNGLTVLLIAASRQNWDMIHFLARAGGNIKVVTSSILYARIIALSYAASYRDWRQVKPLLENGVDCNSLALNGDSILVVAAASRQWDTVRLLIEHGANINAEDRHNQRALFYALPHKFSIQLSTRNPNPASEIVDRLVGKGAKYGRKELDACPKGTLVEEFLRDELPSINVTDDVKSLYPTPYMV